MPESHGTIDKRVAACLLTGKTDCLKRRRTLTKMVMFITLYISLGFKTFSDFSIAVYGFFCFFFFFYSLVYSFVRRICPEKREKKNWGEHGV